MAYADSIPFAVTGKCGSTEITLLPAPKGKGLVIEKECAKILELAGIKDIWSRTRGQTKTKLNLIHALIDALKKGEIDILPALYINEDRKQFINFTTSYLTLSEYFFTRVDSPKIKNI